MDKRSSLLRLIFGAALITLFLLNKDPYWRFLEAAAALLLAHTTGRKIRLFPVFFFTATIILLHLFRPTGAILYQWGPIRIARTNLENGLLRASTLTGLLGLSRFTISHDLPLPGSLGRLMNETFRFLEMFLNESVKDMARHPVQEIDRLLLKSEDSDHTETIKMKHVKAFRIILFGTFSLGLFLFTFFLQHFPQ